MRVFYLHLVWGFSCWWFVLVVGWLFLCYKLFWSGKRSEWRSPSPLYSAEVHSLRVTMLHVIWFSKEDWRRQTVKDKATKIMALAATLPSPQILFVYIPGFQLLFSLRVVLTPVWILSTCTAFCKKMSTHSICVLCRLGVSPNPQVGCLHPATWCVYRVSVDLSARGKCSQTGFEICTLM